tara:strand:- start:34 stop:333 length:300 start_codon:yes stop_codon:yes gene_type:complete
MSKQEIETEIGTFDIKISTRTKTLGSVVDIEITTPSGDTHRDAYSGSNPMAIARTWIFDIGIDLEIAFHDEFNEYQIFEMGRDEDLPIVESVESMRDFA